MGTDQGGELSVLLSGVGGRRGKKAKRKRKKEGGKTGAELLFPLSCRYVRPRRRENLQKGRGEKKIDLATTPHFYFLDQ